MRIFIIIVIGAITLSTGLAQTTVNKTVYQGTGASSVGTDNVNYGYNAANQSTGGQNSSFFGAYTGPASTRSSNFSDCTGFGYFSLQNIGDPFAGSLPFYATGFGNATLKEASTMSVAAGYAALGFELSGTNVAIGANTLTSLAKGLNNVAVGYNALTTLNNNATSVNDNTAVGALALTSNILGVSNTAIGYGALTTGTTGNYNSAVGVNAAANTTGDNNSAVGYTALYSGTATTGNTANGFGALYWATGNYNSALGWSTGPPMANPSLTNTGSFGYNARPTSSNTIVFGNAAATVMIVNTAIYVSSDGRFKTDIKEDVAGLNFILALRPVSYDFDFAALDKHSGADDFSISQTEYPKDKRRIGFIAQEMEAAMTAAKFDFAGLKKPENEHDHYSIAYAMLTVPLTKAIQELSAEKSTIEHKLAQQAAKFQTLKAAAQLSAAKETSKALKGILYQNVPNPFSSETEIRMSVPETASTAQLVIYSLSGAIIKSIPLSNRGDQSVKISAGDLRSGIYLYSLVIDGKSSDTKRMIITN